jgi:hypothetical protein
MLIFESFLYVELGQIVLKGIKTPGSLSTPGDADNPTNLPSGEDQVASRLTNLIVQDAAPHQQHHARPRPPIRPVF